MWSKLGKSVSPCGKKEYMMFGTSITVSASIMMVPTELNIYIALIRTAISSGGTPQRKFIADVEEDQILDCDIDGDWDVLRNRNNEFSL